jgi:hypothetical protein
MIKIKQFKPTVVLITMIDLLFHIKLTCRFSQQGELSISHVAMLATTNRVVYHSPFL